MSLSMSTVLRGQKIFSARSFLVPVPPSAVCPCLPVQKKKNKKKPSKLQITSSRIHDYPYKLHTNTYTPHTQSYKTASQKKLRQQPHLCPPQLVTSSLQHLPSSDATPRLSL